MTDYRQLFNSVARWKRTSERRLSIYIIAARESYHNYEMSSIGLKRGEANPVDALTKASGNGTL